MSNKPQPCLGQIWTYMARDDSKMFFDETIQLVSKNIQGEFEHVTLFGTRSHNTYEPATFSNSTSLWMYDPEAKGSQYWRDKKDSE